MSLLLGRIQALHGDNNLVLGINNIHTRTENKPTIHVVYKYMGFVLV